MNGALLARLAAGSVTMTPSTPSACVRQLKAKTTQRLVFEPLKAISLTLVIAITGNAVIACIVKALIGLRPTPEAEMEGLDLSDHGEEGNILEAKS